MTFIASLVLAVFSFVLTQLLAPKIKQENARPGGLGDIKFPTATEGRVSPIVFGRVLLEGMNVVWYGDLFAEPITKYVRRNLWSGRRITLGFKYYVGVQGAFCRGPIDEFVRMWVGDTEVLNDSAIPGFLSNPKIITIINLNLFGGDEVGSGGIRINAEIYNGAFGQDQDEYLERNQAATLAGTNVQPDYGGTAYGSFHGPNTLTYVSGVLQTNDRTGAYIGNSEQVKAWKFEIGRYPALFPGQTGTQNKIGSSDCNPMNVIYEILTDQEWGFGDQIAPADVDTGAGSSFLAAADTLRTEGNGFSMLIDKEIEAGEFLREVERQIDGSIFLDHRTGKWTVKLVRADYTLASQPLIDDDNSKLLDYDQGAWSDTVNQIQVEYDNRADDYKLANALSQDSANMMMQATGVVGAFKVVPAKSRYPGVKTAETASRIAWRDLRSQSTPLARANVQVFRELWDVTIGSVVRYSNAAKELDELPMRILKIDFGTPENPIMKLWLIEDSFASENAIYAPNNSTNWTPPSTDIEHYQTGELIVEECPRGILVRDPDYAGFELITKIFAAAAAVSGPSYALVQHRFDPPGSGSFFSDGTQISRFAFIGLLTNTLPSGSNNPVASVDVDSDFFDLDVVLNEFQVGLSAASLGVELLHLIRVGDEYMVAQSASSSSGKLRLTNVYRGVLDSVQAAHAAGERVWLLFTGATVSESDFDSSGADLDVRVIPVDLLGEEPSSGTAAVINMATNRRTEKPYPPGAINYDAGANFAAPNVEAAGAGENSLGTSVSWKRRRFTAIDEVAELLADFNPGNNTQYRLRVFVDPSGSNVEVFTGSFATGTGGVFINRLILWNEAAAGTLIRFQIETQHDAPSDATTLASFSVFRHDVIPVSVRDGDAYMGGNLMANDTSEIYTAVDSGTFTVNIGGSYATGAVEYRLNGGSWTSVIAATNTTGTIPGVVATDEIELRHTVNESPDPNYFEVENPSATVVAYGVFISS